MATQTTRTPAVMEGGGAYNRHSSLQSAYVGSMLDLMTRCAELVPVDDASVPLVIADYGSSQGRNSLAPIRAAIETLRRRAGSARPISAVHIDQPANDFSSLFDVLENDPASYLRGDALVFPSAVGRSFYGPVLPPGSVTLGWSSNAVHWLSQVPDAPPDSLSWQLTAFPEIRALFQRRADEDWRGFLSHRGAELRPGGRLLVMLVAAPDDGDFGWGPYRKHVDGELEALIRQGVITADEVARMVNPVVLRSRAELTAPFGRDGVFAGLRLEHLEIGPAIDPFWDDYRRTMDAPAFGKRWGGNLRVTLAPSLASVLDPQRRPEFIDLLEAGVARRFAAEPAPVASSFAKMVLAKLAA